MAQDKPVNILWIQTDEQRTDSLSCYENARGRTPNLTALADRGMLFVNHHVQSPVCVPSRVCELTSCYPHQTGILDNSVHYTWGRWPERLITFPELFAQAGYVTANFGKYHTPLHATWLENWHFEGFPDEAVHGFLGPAYNEEEHEVIHLGHASRSIILSGRYPAVGAGRTPQTYVVDNVIDWLRQYPHVRRPFLLRASFLAPHTPVLAPEPFYSMYDPQDMDWDVPSEDVLASRPRFELTPDSLRRYQAHSDEEYRRMRATYYGLVSHIDEQIGRLLDEMDRLHLLENTVIVFSSDHGDLMGEYGQFQKGMFYDLTTRVPLLMAGPGISEGERAHRLTEAVDLGPTLLELADLRVPIYMQGRSLLDGEPRRDVIGEICLLRNGQLTRRSWIRTERWSLDFTSEIDGMPTRSAQERDGKLVDLVHDPQEHNNLYGEARYSDIIEVLAERFHQRTAANRRPVQIGRNPYAEG